MDEYSFPGPLGKPLRREDWYYIANGTLVSCTVTVYPGELVGVPQKIFDQLTTGEIYETERSRENVLLVGYSALVPLLEKNGFARL